MPTQIALLRGINVGGNNMVSMAQLRELLESLGFANPRTLLQSGNVVLNSPHLWGPSLEKKLEVSIGRKFGAAIDCVTRSAPEWKSLVAQNPFPKQAKSDPGHTLVMCFKNQVPQAAVKELRKSYTGLEQFQSVGRELYLVYPAGVGASKLTNTLIERKLGARGTARNWNTVLKLAAMITD